MNLDDVDVVAVVPPQLYKQLFLGDHSASIPGQRLEQVELDFGQVQTMRVAVRGTTGHVDDQINDLVHGVVAIVASAPNCDVHARQQLADPERFYDVVVRAGVES